jgi:ABC-type glycerol-3-phosphate transport system substrate-binding protein
MTIITSISKTLFAGAALSLVMTAGGAAFAQERTTIRFLTSDNEPAQVEALKGAVAEFEAKNPTIHVELEVYAVAARLKKLQAEINARNAPDVVKIVPEERLVWGSQGYFAPLDDVYKSIGEDAFVPGSVVKVDGKVYDLPYVINHFSILWYRDDLLKAKGIKPPTNMDELKKAAEALTVKGADGQISQFGIAYPASNVRQTSLQLAQFMWSNGGTFFDKNMKVTFDNPGTVAALTTMRDLAAFAPPALGSYSTNEVADAYALGKAAMAISSGALGLRVIQNAPDLFANTKAMRFPAGSAGSFFFAGTNSMALASEKIGGKHIAESKKFLTYFLGSKYYRDYLLARGGQDISPLKSLVADPKLIAETSIYGKRPDLAKVAFDVSNTLDFDADAGATFSGGNAQSGGQLNPYIAAVIARNIPATAVQKVLIEKMSPADAAKWGAAEFEKVVADLK